MVERTRLTPQRRRILEVLTRKELQDVPPTAREIACYCKEGNRASDWAHGKLREMAWHGLVERVGIAFDNASTWRISAAGRAALQQEPARDE